MHPLIVRRLLLPLHERLIGRDTWSRLASWEESQWWPQERLAELQIEKLRLLLSHAATRVPYYRAVIQSSGVNPSTATPGDLSRLPTLDKSAIAANLDQMTDRATPGGLIPYTTGGSTGQPLSFFIDRPRQAADQAARARSRRWFGIEPGDREVLLWGSPIEATTQDRVKSLRDRLTNQRLLSAFDMTPRTMAAYVREIERFNPAHLFGYPSSLARLARFCHDSGTRLHVPTLRAVFTTGEVLDPAERATLEEWLGVPVADGYGAREAGFIAHQCPQGTYHVTMESVIVELLDDHGATVSPGERGEITVTHLDAFAMPFIRYRTGDYARLDERPCPCGRGLIGLRDLDGRRTDQLRTTAGGHAHALAAIYAVRSCPDIAEFRIVQRASLDLDVDLIERRPLSPATVDRIRNELTARIGPVTVRINRVARIAPSASGKHRCVISEVL